VITKADHWARRVARPWRVAFVLYALALTVATHWPALALGTEAQPAPDKLLHMLVFAGLTVLLWRTRWVRSPLLVVVLVLVWAMVDELTQGLPILRRTSSWQDVVAGQLGVVLVAAWWWALAPVGEAPNRLRLAYQSFIVTDLCARWRTILLAVAAALAGAVVVGFLAWLVLRAAGPLYGNPGNVIVAVIVGGVAAAQVTMAALFGPRARELADHRPCFACGTSCREVVYEESGRGRCPSCGESVHRGQWARPMQLPMAAALRGAGRAALTAVVLIAVAVGLYWIVLVLSMRWTVAKELLGAWQRLTLDMRLAFDAALVGLAVALAVRIYRQRQARLHDRQHLECRGCGHDLTGAPLDHGLGTCPECGAGFARIV
jgi:Zn finger protein HypA/HybF involved in hydrogenase expression